MLLGSSTCRSSRITRIWAGSNDLLTLQANKTWWQKVWFRPRVMRNVREVRTRSTLLGSEVTMPVYIAPMGIAKTAGPEGEGSCSNANLRLTRFDDQKTIENRAYNKT